MGPVPWPGREHRYPAVPRGRPPFLRALLLPWGFPGSALQPLLSSGSRLRPEEPGQPGSPNPPQGFPPNKREEGSRWGAARVVQECANRHQEPGQAEGMTYGSRGHTRASVSWRPPPAQAQTPASGVPWSPGNKPLRWPRAPPGPPPAACKLGFPPRAPVSLSAAHCPPPAPPHGRVDATTLTPPAELLQAGGRVSSIHAQVSRFITGGPHGPGSSRDSPRSQPSEGIKRNSRPDARGDGPDARPLPTRSRKLAIKL